MRSTRRRTVAALLPVLALGGLLTACGSTTDGGAGSRSAGPSGAMVLATTTSTQDTGLLDTLVPDFEKGSACRVKTVAVGSGEALALGASGDADVLLVHSPAAEQQYMAEGHGHSRKPVMHNDFVLVGPAADPAGAATAADAAAAMATIARAEQPFASRADNSGTNAKELALWQQAGITPKGSWYLKTGQGMGETLTIAGQKQAYTLSDRGTFLATKGVDLRILVQGSADLLNPYHVIVVKHAGTNVGCARQFAHWLVTPTTQRVIKAFGVSTYGQPLFFPDVVR